MDNSKKILDYLEKISNQLDDLKFLMTPNKINITGYEMPRNIDIEREEE